MPTLEVSVNGQVVAVVREQDGTTPLGVSFGLSQGIEGCEWTVVEGLPRSALKLRALSDTDLVVIRVLES